MLTFDSILASLIRFTESRIICTGGVVFIGDGGTGKTHTALNLTSNSSRAFYNQTNESLKKSVNLELNYFILQSNIEEYQITTSSQLFIMPGQKGRAERGQGLAFEDAVDFYLQASSIKVVLALVLTYDLTDLSTFQELEYWLERAIERDMIKNYTSIIILGTHLDVDKEQLNDDYIEGSKKYIQSLILDKIGIEKDLENIHSVKISNTTEEGIEELKQAINQSFISAFKIQEILKAEE